MTPRGSGLGETGRKAGGNVENPASGRHLLELREVAGLLGLEVKDVEWLVATGQLTEVRVCGKRRFDSKDVDELIEMYKRVQARRRDDEKA